MVDIQTKIPSFASESGFARPEVGATRELAVQRERGMNLDLDLGNGNGNGNTGITGVQAHAAVRMHAYPVSAFWAFCPKTKTPHFQRWKVALS